MSLWVPSGSNDFTWQTSNVAAARPSANSGTSVTPGNNTKGSYAAVLTSGNVAFDVFGMLININSNSVSAAARNTLVDIGVDPAGGSSYSVLVPNLLGSCATSLIVGFGLNYYFPIWVKAGSSIGARASVNNATVGTLRVIVTVFGKPRLPQLAKVGTYVTDFGTTAASSSGTAVTSGTVSVGAYTSLGTLAKEYWYWQQGLGINDSTMTSGNLYNGDLAFGDGSNKQLIIRNQMWAIPNANESLMSALPLGLGPRVVANGASVFGRLQCSGTADSSLSMIAYGVGG